MAAVGSSHVRTDLEKCASWYCESEPAWGGPLSKESLLALSDTLWQTYMNIAALIGLDPCDQFEDSKLKISHIREVKIEDRSSPTLILNCIK
jgi:hypothetical protein